MLKRGMAVATLLILFLFLSSSALYAKDNKYPGEDEFVAVDQPAMMTVTSTPIYPDAAKNNKVEGVVWVKALVDETGAVVEAKVAKSSVKDQGFEEAALVAAKQCKYSPAVKNGKPVAIWVTYKVDFTLADGPKKD